MMFSASGILWSFVWVFSVITCVGAYDPYTRFRQCPASSKSLFTYILIYISLNEKSPSSVIGSLVCFYGNLGTFFYVDT